MPGGGGARPISAHAKGSAPSEPVRLHAVVPSGPPPAILPLADVRPGMVGQAMTVFQGTKPEPFKVRVVAVMRNFLPKQDVILIRADVTYVDKSSVLAFGHPLFGMGEVYLPMVDAEIHAFLPSLQQSFKMSSPLNEVGTLVQDRQSCIIGDLDTHSTMMPIDVRVTGPGAEPRLFHAEVARNRRLTPMLASMVVGNAIADAEPDVTDMVVTVTSKVGMKGFAPLELRDQIFTTEGVSGRALSSSRGLRALGDLMFNPFEPVVLDRMDVDVRVEFRRDVAEIVAVSLPGEDVHAGDTVPVRVTLRPYAGPEYVETVPVIIPRAMAGETVKIEVASGAVAKPEVPQAESLRGYIDNLRRFYTASSIVVTLQTPDDGASLRGRLLSTLPSAALDTLRPGNQTRRADAYHVADRTIFPSSRLVSGRQELSVAVRDDNLGRDLDR
jgi:hypothetical protein